MGDSVMFKRFKIVFKGIRILPLISAVLSLFTLLFFSISTLFFHGDMNRFVLQNAQLISISLLIFSISLLIVLLLVIQPVRGLVADNLALTASNEDTNRKFARQYFYSYISGNFSQSIKFDYSNIKYLPFHDGQKYGMAMALIDQIANFRKLSDQQKENTYIEGVKIFEQLSEHLIIQAFIDRDFFLLLWQAENVIHIKDKLQEAQHIILQKLEVQLTFFCTNSSYSIEELPKVYSFMCQDTPNRLFYKSGSLIWSSMKQWESLKIDEPLLKSYQKQLEQLAVQLESGDLQNIDAFGALLHEQKKNWLQYQNALILMRSRLEQCRLLLISKQKIDIDIILPSNIENFERASEIEQLINHTVGIILDAMNTAGARRVGNYIQQVNQLIMLHFSDSNYGVQQIADSMGISSGYIGKLYKNNMGISILDRLKAVRHEKALELLDEGQIAVTDIYKYCGYSSVHYFYNVFKNETGMTPKQYQRATHKD